MKKNILILQIIVILTIMLVVITGCGTSNELQNESLNEETEKKIDETLSEEDTNIDYTAYTNTFVSKIIETSTYYYAIEDIDNDEIPELLTKTGNKNSNTNFTVYKYVEDTLKEVTYENMAINFNGITELSRKKYEDGSIIYVIDEFESASTSNGGYIDLAYIKGNEYIEYSRVIGADLDTLSSSEISKITLNLDTYKVDIKSFDYEINTSATSMDKAVVSSEYNEELENDKQEIEQNLRSTEKVTFYQSSFSEWEHDDTELTQEVQKILEQLNNK